MTAVLESFLDLLATKSGPSLRSTSWPYYCLQGIDDLLRVFWWLGSRFGAPQNLATSSSAPARTERPDKLRKYLVNFLCISVTGDHSVDNIFMTLWLYPKIIN